MNVVSLDWHRQQRERVEASLASVHHPDVYAKRQPIVDHPIIRIVANDR